jgi:hypothetical protein
MRGVQNPGSKAKHLTKAYTQLIFNPQNTSFTFSPSLDRRHSSRARSGRASQSPRSRITTSKPEAYPGIKQARSRVKAHHQTTRDSVAAIPTGIQSSHWSLPKGHYDLLHAVARLGAAEERLGYTFRDKFLGLTAIKPDGYSLTVSFEGRSWPLPGHKRLALLGDRALDLALCQTWYESGQPPCMSCCYCNA